MSSPETGAGRAGAAAASSINTAPVTEVAFVTHARAPETTHDDRLAADVLESRGCRVLSVAWDDAAADWSRFACVVIRSTWDYHEKLAAYETWLRRLASARVNLWNPADVVLGNLNKRYLAELEQRGVPVVPTEYLPAQRGRQLADVLGRRGWDDVVVKPAVSLGAYGTWRTSASTPEADQERFEHQCASHDVLVQPCLAEIESDGEWSVVFIAGRYSHATLKHPAAGDFRVTAAFRRARRWGDAVVAPDQSGLRDPRRCPLAVALCPRGWRRVRRSFPADGTRDQRTESVPGILAAGSGPIRGCD